MVSGYQFWWEDDGTTDLKGLQCIPLEMSGMSGGMTIQSLVNWFLLEMKIWARSNVEGYGSHG